LKGQNPDIASLIRATILLVRCGQMRARHRRAQALPRRLGRQAADAAPASGARLDLARGRRVPLSRDDARRTVGERVSPADRRWAGGSRLIFGPRGRSPVADRARGAPDRKDPKDAIEVPVQSSPRVGPISNCSSRLGWHPCSVRSPSSPCDPTARLPRVQVRRPPSARRSPEREPVTLRHEGAPALSCPGR
jgi:hypothetical protein